MLINKRLLRQEVALLSYLAIHTQRSLLVPNVLIGVGVGIPGQPVDVQRTCGSEEYRQAAYCQSYLEQGQVYEGAEVMYSNNSFTPEFR